jgi:hypothetical protein
MSFNPIKILSGMEVVSGTVRRRIHWGKTGEEDLSDTPQHVYREGR